MLLAPNVSNRITRITIDRTTKVSTDSNESGRQPHSVYLNTCTFHPRCDHVNRDTLPRSPEDVVHHTAWAAHDLSLLHRDCDSGVVVHHDARTTDSEAFVLPGSSALHDAHTSGSSALHDACTSDSTSFCRKFHTSHTSNTNVPCATRLLGSPLATQLCAKL